MVITARPPAGAEVAPAAVVRPLWRRVRFWAALAVAVALAAVVVGSLSRAPGRPLDPASTEPGGGKALARLVSAYGTAVTATSSLADAAPGSVVLVTQPDAYSRDQLATLAGTADHVVLVSPGRDALAALAPGVRPEPVGSIDADPDCNFPAARAAGTVDWPTDLQTYTSGRGDTRCYGGALVVAGRVAVLGSGSVLTNDSLDGAGAAALGVNLLTVNRTADRLVWLLPGADAGADGPASVWDLFPDGAYRAFWWLVGVGLVVALWRGRRLGAAVTEPLPVVVRAAELVEGHGRLYEQSGARDRAAAALRAGVTRRLAERIGLPATASPAEVAQAVAPTVGRSPAEVTGVLAGPAPADDAALLRLAGDLDTLTRSVSEGTR